MGVINKIATIYLVIIRIIIPLPRKIQFSCKKIISRNLLILVNCVHGNVKINKRTISLLMIIMIFDSSKLQHLH